MKSSLIRWVLLLPSFLWLCGCKSSTHSILERAQAGESHAQYEYGRRLLTGQKSKKNPQLALGWFLAAAQQGHAKAQAALGACYQQGVGHPRHEKTALSWYNKAAAQGNEHAMMALLAHADKQTSTTAAKRTLQQLLDAENPLAELYMATRLMKNETDQAALCQAVDYLRYAAMGGNGEAALLLSLCYLEGTGVHPSPDLSMGWFGIALELQSETAQLILQQMQNTPQTGHRDVSFFKILVKKRDIILFQQT